MYWIDSHCHLDFTVFDEDREALLKTAEECDVRQFVVPGVGAASWSRVLNLAQRHGALAPALGLHPYFLDEHHQSHLKQLEQALTTHSVVAVGECGLDFYHGDAQRELQAFYLHEQLHIAKRQGLPVILHSRKANDVLAKHLREVGVEGGVIHAFSGSWQQAKVFVDLGFKLGLGGAITWERAQKLSSVVKQLPNDGYVLETDSPDMMPSFGEPGGRNTPLNLPKIAQYVANIRGESLEHVMVAAYHNTFEAFPKLLTIEP